MCYTTAITTQTNTIISFHCLLQHTNRSIHSNNTSSIPNQNQHPTPLHYNTQSSTQYHRASNPKIDPSKLTFNFFHTSLEAGKKKSKTAAYIELCFPSNHFFNYFQQHCSSPIAAIASILNPSTAFFSITICLVFQPRRSPRSQNLQPSKSNSSCHNPNKQQRQPPPRLTPATPRLPPSVTPATAATTAITRPSSISAPSQQRIQI